MTQVHSSIQTISLKEALSFQNENYFLSFPVSEHNFHPHQTFLIWLLKNVDPQKIAVFDNTPQNTQVFLCNIIQFLGINSECYGNVSQPRNRLHINTLIPLTPDIDLAAISMIYIDISNEIIKSNPFLSFTESNVPPNKIFIFNNLYRQNSIAEQNRHLINQWKRQYPFLEFSHHQGLMILYTGLSTCQILTELFDLKNTPKLEQTFKIHCAVTDEYWQLKRHSNTTSTINTKKQIVEAKTETYLLQQEIYYREKALQHSIKKSKEIAEDQLNALYTKLNASTGELQSYDSAFDQFTLWRDNTQEKLKSIEYLLEKYRLITFFFPKRLRQLLTFLPAPEIPPPSKEHRNVSPLTLDNPTESPCTQKEYFQRPRHIIFIAGEPNTPGVVYRCHRNAAACIMAGHKAHVIHASDISPKDIEWADILILWRVEFSGHILGIIDLAKEYNTLTAFDADDIVFKPHFAYIEIIDGIRTIGTTEAETSRTFGNMKQTLMRTDFAVATTQEMREHMAQELIPKHAGPLVFTLPNIFDDDCVRVSRFFNRINKANKDDNYVRIGYASGTRTHQRDFALVIPALIAIFQKRPQVRLVLFREPENHRPILHMNEFPELDDFQDRIEWRDTVPLRQLPQELARLDISIAPLEADNVFCNAKSELKFFEAALANVCSIVSPTGPLSRCVQHGITGFIANNTEEWEEYLLTLIDDPALRKKMSQEAYHDVLWNFSTQRQSHLCDTMLLSLTGEKGAAQAMETMIARKEYKNLSMPIIPESEILFDHDALQEADVTVVITSYNYSQFIIEAMESVRAQTLKHLDMIIVDDGSSDDSIELIIAWAKEHKNRFNRLQLHRSLKNTGLGGARNIGIAASETLYSMQLDADNRLLPNTCEKLLKQIKDTAIGYAYPHLRHFGAGEAIGGHVPFHPLRLTVGNYIDAMVMLAKWAWAAAGGYYVQRDAMGWEDYDIWCRLAELGIQGTQVKDAVAEYRAHFSSMTSTVTEQTYHKPKVTSYLAARHPWIKLVLPEESPWIKKKNN
ncbi:glycosyltransferase [Commensalibacter nepenthis]|uniref:Glycosyltransferase n=1 Tax=Commensalibacter nepenthis TaxID=3043872 RepID=A0ABT6Q6P5_9PROT|nr:glycosyltransferase [Commensalibacter sp. TBRC 10068]MDI2112569.1 glycosyltransferase [Commensalibacter sp. TBRC 10068]